MPNQAVSQDQTDTEKVVLAGMKVMYDQKVFPQFIEAFKKGGPISDTLAAQAAGLVKILDDQSKGAIPKRVIVPAATVLLIEMADFLVQSKIAQPTKQDLAEAIKKLTAIILKIYSAPQPGVQAQPMQQQPPASSPAPQAGGLINSQPGA